MRRSPFLLAGATLGLLLTTHAVGCGDDVDTNAPTSDIGEGLVPPAETAGAPAGDGAGVVLAVNKLFLGDTDRSGSPSTSAWKTYGYNLDGRLSKKSSTDHCKPAAGGAPSAVYPDGDDGIDNSFGKNILPIITGLAPDASGEVNTAIGEGDFTIMMDIQGIGSGSSYSGLLTRLYPGAGLDEIPKFDGTDEWPVVPEFLNDPTDITSSKVQFPNAYVTDGTWVSGGFGNIDLTLAVAGYSLTLSIANAVITMDLTNGNQEATNGVIAGILDTEQLTTEIKKVAGGFSPDLCEGTTVESLLDQLRQASDILTDGSQDPNATCNGISIGLGFEAKPVMLGGIAPLTPPGEDPCNPSMGQGGGGTGGNTGTGGNSGTGGNGTGGAGGG